MTPKTCPQCGGLTEIDGKSCSCGWRARGQSASGAAPALRKCAWNDHGAPCHAIGHLSQSTLGGGPWYCRDHFADLMSMPRHRIGPVIDSIVDLDERVNRIVSRETGESEHAWSMRCRDWVRARLKRPAQLLGGRQPGEEG